MAKFVIEKNIPAPAKGRKYPLNDLEIGDSFMVKLNEEKEINKQKQNIYMAIWKFCKVYPDKKFTTASFGNEVRIWRIQKTINL